ncbi:hypothetical protein QJS10_CPB17g01162 [Acorus calamus]|uniref:Cotton fiber protein n=1 Tax=Acorus calamus TaxID=4465 RepID=A0AAV9CV47_ACOCL|nr:hypothetical protein QJS10_CPB17g01162 [Acorus calamus]
MAKKKTAAITGRAWHLLRLAFKRGPVLQFHLRVIPNYIRSLRAATARSSTDRRIQCGERELSFEETPMFNFGGRHGSSSSSMRMLMPRIPCINKRPEVEWDFEEEEGFFGREWEEEEMVGEEEEVRVSVGGDREEEMVGIDMRAEEFIERFYEQMKLQRQSSYLQYKEMLQRSVN